MKTSYRALAVMLLLATMAGSLQKEQISKASIAGSHMVAPQLFKLNQNKKAAPDPIPENTIAMIQQDIAKREYHITRDKEKGTLQSPNRKQNLRAYYKSGEFVVQNRIDSAGHNFKLKLVTEGIYADGKKLFSPQTDAQSAVNENILRIRHEGFTEEYINNEQGVRQNFIINSAPKGTKGVAIKLSANGLEVKNASSNKLQFESKTGERLTYNDLKCWDANGISLKASLAYTSGKIGIEVDVKGAAFPVVVDPIIMNGTVDNADKTIFGTQAYQQYARSIGSAGDVNGDGYSDIIVGAPYHDGTLADQGAAFLYFGSSTGINVQSQTLVCDKANAQFGSSVATAGDINKDGFSDVVIGSENYTSTKKSEGAAFIYYGSPVGLTQNKDLLLCNTELAALGSSVASAGDLNGDGFSDIIVGARKFNQQGIYTGACFVYHGSADGIIKNPAKVLLPNGPVDLDFCAFGSSVSSAGDIDGDGYGDVIVGAPDYDNWRGAAYVFKGSAAGVQPTPAVRYEGINKGFDFIDIGDALGTSVSTAGDLNGDGYGDIIIGSPGAPTAQSGQKSGIASVYYGSSSGLASSPSKTLAGPSNEYNWAGFGQTVACAGDIDGDGFSDILIGAPGFSGSDGNSPLYGIALIYNGSDKGISDSPYSSIKGNQTSMHLGASLSGAGDINGDGYSDIILGGNAYTGGADFGAIFLFHGFPSGIDKDLANGSPSGQAASLLAFSVASAGDLNGDGFSDIAVGAPNYDNGELNEGVVRVYFGSTSGIDFSNFTLLESNQANANLGIAVSSAGDTNGDGYDDLLVGASNYSNGQAGEGAAFLFHGMQSGINTTPFSILESNQVNAQFGASVTGIGDTNADGYSDIMIGAPNAGGGAGNVFVYYGKAQGITSNSAILLIAELDGIQAAGRKVAGIGDVNGDGFSDAATTIDFDGGGTITTYLGSKTGLHISPVGSLQTGGILCASLSSAGDINGDGYNDLVAGIPGFSGKGGMFIYYGSAAGLTQNAVVKLAGSGTSGFGNSVSTAGDVNGDGYSDIICGDPTFSNGQAGEGAAFIYYGSENGLLTQNPITLEINLQLAGFGTSISGAGDVNGDGYSDILGGAPYFNNQFQSEGAAVIYYGNNSGLKNNLRLYNKDLSTSINHSNASQEQFGVGLFEKSFIGRNKGKLVWETKKEGESFSHNSPITNSAQFTGQQAGYSDLGLSGIELKNLVSKSGIATKIRARVKFDPVLAITGQVYGPWRYLSAYSSGGSFYQSTPLPVTLVNFNAEKSEKYVNLEWVTANEENSESFEVQRSRDGKIWKKLGSVSAQQNSSQEWHYQFTDSSAAPGTNFYRLKMIDQDQTYTFSRVRSVSMGGISENMINLFPNPTVDKLSLSANGGDILEVRITNVAGIEVMRIIDPETEIDVKQLKPGVYIVVLQLADGNTVSKSIVKK